MTREQDIRAREQAATKGPWAYSAVDGQSTWLESPGEDVLIHDERGTGHMRENFSWIKKADAVFIAYARTDIPWLLDENAKLRAALDAVAKLHEEDLFRGHLSNGCKVCGNGNNGQGYPCPTVRAITEAVE